MTSMIFVPKTISLRDNSTEVPDKRKRIVAYNQLVHTFPKANFTLLRALSAYLVTVVNNSDINKMNLRNIDIVFSPTLHIPNPVINMFILEFDAIFGEPLEDVTVPSIKVGANEPLTPEDIRSPRKQIFSDIPTPSYAQNSFSDANRQIANNSSLSPGHEEVLQSSQANHDTGFVPLQPTYGAAPQQGSITMPGPEYAVARPRNLAPGGAAKARRRESSMLLMDHVQHKSSLSTMRDDSGESLRSSLKVKALIRGQICCTKKTQPFKHLYGPQLSLVILICKRNVLYPTDRGNLH